MGRSRGARTTQKGIIWELRNPSDAVKVRCLGGALPAGLNGRRGVCLCQMGPKDKPTLCAIATQPAAPLPSSAASRHLRVLRSSQIIPFLRGWRPSSVSHSHAPRHLCCREAGVLLSRTPARRPGQGRQAKNTELSLLWSMVPSQCYRTITGTEQCTSAHQSYILRS